MCSTLHFTTQFSRLILKEILTYLKSYLVLSYALSEYKIMTCANI